MSKKSVALILLAAVVGTAVGFMCRNAAFARKEKEQQDQFWLSQFRLIAWRLSEHFRPEGFALMEKIPNEEDELFIQAPVPWGNEKDPGDQITQESLVWLNEEGGFAIVVHMVLTDVDLGRGTLAYVGRDYRFSDPRFGGTDFVDLVDDFYYVGARDRMIFIFHEVPFRPDLLLCKSPPPHRSAESQGQAETFLEEFRNFLDMGTNVYPHPY